MMKHTRYILLTLTLIVLLLSVSTVFAKKKKKAAPPPPTVTVVSRWTPQEQLTTGDDDGSFVIEVDEHRKVNLQMSARSDRQFWAMDISCLLNIDVLEASPTMTAAGGWYEGDGTTFSDVTISYYDTVEKRINATFTRVGASNSPMGINGANYTEFLFDLEFTVKETLPVGTTNVVSITCDKLSFVDRNGVTLGTAILDSTNNLIISDGYVLTGSVARQGSTDKSEIDVTCQHESTGATHIITTGVTGEFSFSNDPDSPGNPLRKYGRYICDFTSAIGGANDQPILQGFTYINLQTPSFNLQPVILRTGNTDLSNDGVTVADFPLITGNWLSTQLPYTNGDVNGDGLVNETDLALTASNIGLTTGNACGATFCQELDHVIYSAARDFNGTFPNNSLLIGDVISGDVSALNGDRVFWPQVSPDGSQIAFYGSSTKYFDKKGRALPTSNKAVKIVVEEGILVGDTTDFSGSLVAGGKGFAPSWSPSGNKIAYVCSWDGFLNGNEDLGGYQFNNGNICVVNASGGSIQTIIPAGARSTFAEIFPPAWYDETTIIYAGNDQNPVCSNELCYYDMLTNTHGLVDIQFGVDGTDLFATMPIIIQGYGEETYLFYRRYATPTSGFPTEIRMGPIDYSGGSWSGGVLTTDIDTAGLHETVNTTTNVSYYDVSPMLDVMFYKFGDTQFHNRYLDFGSTYEWSTDDSHMVDGFIGYPMTSEFVEVWDGDEDNATDYHAFRATFDWIP